MIATVIHLIEAIRRALKRANKGLSMIAETFAEALDQHRAARRKYPFSQ